MLRSRRFAVLPVVVFAAIAFTAFMNNAAHAQITSASLAPRPPMGWNSWDAYGLTISEDDFKANVTVLAGMKELGWKYAVIDEGWYMEDPFGGKPEKQKYVYDDNGRLIPAVNRFPDSANGAGLKPLADWVHAQGLKFGIHLVRGIPRRDVAANTPIAGSKFTAADAGDTSDACPWDEGNWGVKDNAAGHAWYDSMIGLYAGWGVDFLKVDCISDHPYKPVEIRLVANAIKKTGRPIVLSLSPGPTNLKDAAYVAKYSQMWRIADDHWDVWSHPIETDPKHEEFPMGTKQAFDRIAAWQPYFKAGSWPDEDMLPIGSLTPHPGWGQPRDSRLTHDEEQTEFTLWAISRSPLILGANLTKLDDFTRSLIANKEVDALNQTAVVSKPGSMPMGDGAAGANPQRLWYARTGGSKPKSYAAVFNLGDEAATWEIPWASFHLMDKPHAAFEVWTQKQAASAKTLHVELPPHGSALFRIE